MRDEKSRNAYKRYWRNKRNARNYMAEWREATQQANDAAGRANRSLALMSKARKEMESVS